MREGWLVGPGGKWAWRFHRDDKALVRDPKVFMGRGMPVPDGHHLCSRNAEEPSRERRGDQEDAEAIRRNLKSMGWQRSEPLWGPSAER